MPDEQQQPDMPVSACDVAKGLVNGPRQRDYRHPALNGELIGVMWGEYLGIGPIPAELVMQMLILLKVARGAPRPEAHDSVELAMIAAAVEMKDDTVLDEAGYAECTWKVMRYHRGFEGSDGSTIPAALAL